MKIDWRRIPVCFPLVPLKRIDSQEKENETYFHSQSSLFLNAKTYFIGVQIRVNLNSGRGVFLDYYGCNIYDQFMELEKISHVFGQLNNEWSSCSERHRLLQQLFKTTYRLGYCILIEDLTAYEPVPPDIKRKGIDIFGSAYRFKKWLSIRNYGMKGKTPKQVLATGLLGIEMVYDALVDLEPWTDVELQFMFFQKRRGLR